MSEVKLRHCGPSDVESVVSFVEECPPLDLHSPFTYWVTFRYWGETCFVALDGDQIVGYASAIGSGVDRGVFYLWQVGVDTAFRSTGLARRLITAIVEVARDRGLHEMQVSIASENTASLFLFRRFAKSIERPLEQRGEISFTDPSGKAVRENLYGLEIL